MKRIVTTLAAVAALACLAAEAPEGKPDDGHKRTPPAWLKKPNGDQLLAVYPGPALQQGVSGRGVLDCEVGVDGLLRKCAPLSETPTNSGFAAAALLVAPQFRFKPATLDGVPVPSRVHIPVNFAVAGGYRGPTPTTMKPVKPGAGQHMVYTKPIWETAPTRADVAAARPPKATGEGRAVLQCEFDSKRQLRNCDVVQEEPHDQGFGAAAKKLSYRFRAEQMADRRPFVDDVTRFAVQFDAPAADPDASGAMVISKPEWKTLPELKDFDAVYPKAAREAKVAEGRGLVDCAVAVGGALVDCKLVSESPPALGFGEAALRLAPHFALNPWTFDGRPVDGARIRLPIHFVNEPPAPPAPK